MENNEFNKEHPRDVNNQKFVDKAKVDGVGTVKGGLNNSDKFKPLKKDRKKQHYNNNVVRVLSSIYANYSFDKQIQKAMDCDFKTGNWLIVAKDTQNDLSLTNIDVLENKPLLMKETTVRKIIDDHDIKVSDLKNLPELIKKSPLAYTSLSEAGGVVIVLDLIDKNDKDVIVPIHLDIEKSGFVINEVPSTYGKNNIQRQLNILNKLNEKIYFNEKSNSWAHARGLQLPPHVTQHNFNSISKIDKKQNYGK